MADKVMTAPLAVIKVNGVPVGFMKNIRVSESITRGRVSGLGQLTPSELPATAWNGKINCGFYTIDLNKTGIPNAIKRDLNTIRQWVDNVLLQEDGVDIDIFKKAKDSVDGDGIITPRFDVFASVKGCFMDNQNFDISEGQISGSNQDFSYINPILTI